MKLNTKRTVFIGMAFMSIIGFWQLYDQVVPLMLRNTFGFGDTLIGVVMAADNVLALFLLPLFGAASDTCRARLGRRMPFILAGTLAAAVMTVLLPVADTARDLPMFLLVLAMLLIAMAVYRAPAVALMPDITPKPLRSKGNAIINLMGAIGGMISLVLISLLVKSTPRARTNYESVFMAVALMMVFSLFVLLLTVRERKLVRQMHAIHYGVDPFAAETAIIDVTGAERLSPAMRRSMLLILASVALWYMGYNAATSAFSRYAQEVWGQSVSQSSIVMLIANAGAILSYIPIGYLSSRTGRKRMIQFGVILMVMCFGTIAFFSAFTPAAYAIFALVGCAWACINVNSYPMVVEMSRGASIGKYTGYYYAFSMAAQMITPVVSGFLLERIGYWTLFPYAACMVALSLATITLARHGESLPERPAEAVLAFEEAL